MFDFVAVSIQSCEFNLVKFNLIKRYLPSNVFKKTKLSLPGKLVQKCPIKMEVAAIGEQIGALFSSIMNKCVSDGTQ